MKTTITKKNARPSVQVLPVTETSTALDTANKASRIILVSNRLPVRFTEDGEVERTHGGLASALEAVETDSEIVWVGWTGMTIEEGAGLAELSEKMSAMGIEPVHLSDEEIDGFYEGYSNATLWPLLHGMSQRSQFEGDYWTHYKEANRKFADAILEVANDGDLVWIHDYHLFLVPELLRQSGRDLKIGFFLHTPFPSSDCFRILPERHEILKGVLGADLIGFHTYNYLRHFRSSLLRILGVETEHDSVLLDGRAHRLGVFPIGHNRKGFLKAMTTREFESAYDSLEKSLQGKKLVLNVERLDYTKGVPQKLAAIRHFLENHPEQRNEVVFVLIAVPSRQNVEEYVELTEEVQREVGSINGEYGSIDHVPVNFLHRGYPPEELAAFYAMADVCLVTPLVDGMNLVAKEFVDCKERGGRSKPGVLVLSEFAGAAAEMSQALLVNPYSESEVSAAISEALRMAGQERWERLVIMQSHLERNDAGAWAGRYLRSFDDQKSEDESGEGSLLSVFENLVSSSKDGKKVSLFLDYDGTLRNFTLRPEDATPDPELVPLLKRLQEKADVTLVSGRPAEFLEEHFGGCGFNLVAEHGYRWSLRGGGGWQLLNPHVDVSWKEKVLPQLEQITWQTPGSHIEEKPSALVWHYRRADLEFGDWQARRLLSELTELTASLPVAVHHGKKIIEVASMQVNKGLAVEGLLSRDGGDVALVVGDDQTDETMFALEPAIEKFHSVHIGGSDTRAGHYTSFDHFRQFLEGLADSLER